MTAYAEPRVLAGTCVDGPASDVAVDALLGHEPIVTVRVTLVETAEALARARTQRRLSHPATRRAWAAFEQVWRDLIVLELTPHLVDAAAQLALRHHLSTSHALHLAAARAIPQPAPLICSDRVLADAARRENLWVITL